MQFIKVESIMAHHSHTTTPLVVCFNEHTEKLCNIHWGSNILCVQLLVGHHCMFVPAGRR